MATHTEYNKPVVIAQSNNNPVCSSEIVRMRYRGSMPRPQKEHGDEMLGGTVQGRLWTGTGWEYRIIHKTAGVCYVCEHPNDQHPA